MAPLAPAWTLPRPLTALALPALSLCLVTGAEAEELAGGPAAGVDAAPTLAAPIELPTPKGTIEGYAFIGRGICVDARRQRFEEWYMPGEQSEALVYKDWNISLCACPECKRACDQLAACVGFGYFCCPEGDNCEGGAAVLFAMGTRPEVAPPGAFSTIGPRNFPTAGATFEGTGPIASVFPDNDPHRYCYSKDHTTEIAAPSTIPGIATPPALVAPGIVTPLPLVAPGVAPPPAMIAPGIATPVYVVPPLGYEFVGQGLCVDAQEQRFEEWYLQGSQAQALVYDNWDINSCHCPECQAACDSAAECVGFGYSCCPRGDKCSGGGAVLFSKGTRPSDAPPGNFSTVGPRGFGTAGEAFGGTTRIDHTSGGPEDPHRFCFRKLALGPTPFPVLTSMPPFPAALPLTVPPPAFPQQERSATASEDMKYDLVGHGWCQDARGRKYEQWYMEGSKSRALYYTGGNRDSCQCPECHHACDHFLVCLGFEFNCCPEGERCLAGGAVLFSRGLRPGASAPGNFSLVGPSGSETSGADFQGSGPIAKVEADGNDPNIFCYRKWEVGALPPSDVKVGSYYEPHTMEGTAKTIEASWSACADRCVNTDGCKTWAFWPDGGCHLQGSNTKLVKAECPTDEPVCDALGVITGARGTFLNMAVRAIDDTETPAANSTGSAPWDVGSTLGKTEFRGIAALILLLVVAGAVLYMFAQADWSKHRKKKRLIKNARLRKQAAAAEASMGSSGNDDETEDSDSSSSEDQPLKGNKARP